MIKINNISKRYLINDTKSIESDNLFSKWKYNLGRKKSELWALRNVDFSIPKGKTYGIIGKNGAGKTTLLKLVSGITSPTKGNIVIDGSVSSLLGASVGFKPELSGRENVFFNAAILGMSNSKVKEKFAEIIDFSEIGKFIDTPIKRYSSGMKVRLAFSVAVFLDTEVLLIDEVLSVGDYSFRQKSLKKMLEMKEDNKTTMMFVSHNMGIVNKFCDQVIWLDNGEIKEIGPSEKVVNSYIKYSQPSIIHKKDNLVHKGSGKAIFQKVEVLNSAGVESTKFIHGTRIEFRIKIEKITEEIKNPIFSIFFKRDIDNLVVTRLHSGIDGFFVERIDGMFEFSIKIESIMLMPGKYKIIPECADNSEVFDRISSGIQIEILHGPKTNSLNYKYESSNFMVYTDALWEEI